MGEGCFVKEEGNMQGSYVMYPESSLGRDWLGNVTWGAHLWGSSPQPPHVETGALLQNISFLEK